MSFACGEKPDVSYDAFRRTRRPIGGSELVDTARLVPRRIDVRGPGLVGREAQRVPDLAGRDLVVADEPGQDRQTGGIGTGPALPAAERWSAGPRSRRCRRATWLPDLWAANSSYSRQASRSTMRMWRSRAALDRGASAGIG